MTTCPMRSKIHHDQPKTPTRYSTTPTPNLLVPYSTRARPREVTTTPDYVETPAPTPAKVDATAAPTPAPTAAPLKKTEACAETRGGCRVKITLI